MNMRPGDLLVTQLQDQIAALNERCNNLTKQLEVTGEMYRLLERELAARKDADKEICICAAVRMGDLVIPCNRHADGFTALRARKLYAQPVLQGFITSRNRFVGRAEGLDLQLAAGILSVRGHYQSQLYAEDLY